MHRREILPPTRPAAFQSVEALRVLFPTARARLQCLPCASRVALTGDSPQPRGIPARRAGLLRFSSLPATGSIFDAQIRAARPLGQTQPSRYRNLASTARPLAL